MGESVSQLDGTADPARILIIRPSALGDVCRSVPVLVGLRRRFPNTRIDWLVQDSFRDAIEAHPDLDAVVAFPRATVAVRRLWRPSACRTLTRFLGSLRGAEYDLVIDCQGLLRSGLFAFTTRARDRVGYREAAELGWLFLNRRVRVPKPLHTVDRMISLASSTGAPEVRDMRLYTPPEASGAWEELGCGARYVVIAPTSRWPGKRWPVERFVEVTRWALEDSRIDRVVLVGGPNEREQCAPLIELSRQKPALLDLIGRTGVGQMMSVIERACLVLANDSAALHIGVGYERPLVALFGPTDVSRVGPYRREDDVLRCAQAPDDVTHKEEQAGQMLMARIETSEVIEACSVRLDAGVALYRDGVCQALGVGV